ncbi:hypothetical protein [Poriferisphaera sp. WC338]|uniref:hypothetical protein n=1 Tax=Poriferisphaera sp. WC338 TaxID=3425129 RepID=UPI003D81A13C
MPNTIVSILESKGFSQYEFWCLYVIESVTLPVNELIDHAADLCAIPPNNRIKTNRYIHEVSMAINSLLAKNVVQIIDEAKLDAIKRYLKENPSGGMPVHGLPQLNSVDFTLDGVKLWLSAADEARDPYQVCCPVFLQPNTTQQQIYATDKAFLDDYLLEIFEINPNQTINNITKIGPWRELWWRRLPEGVTITLEEITTGHYKPI